MTFDRMAFAGAMDEGATRAAAEPATNRTLSIVDRDGTWDSKLLTMTKDQALRETDLLSEPGPRAVQYRAASVKNNVQLYE